MAYNKVVYGGNTLIDLTNDTVTPATLLAGVTAHDKSGAAIEGTVSTYDDTELTGRVTTNEASISALQTKLTLGTMKVQPSTTLKVLLGDDFPWDEDGNAKLRFHGPATGNSLLGTFNQTDSTEDLIAKIESIVDGYYAGAIRYNSATESYDLYDWAERPLDAESASEYIIFLYGQAVSTGLSLTDIFITPANTEYSTVKGYVEATKEIINSLLNGKEMAANKTTSISASSTDAQYPSAKAVYTLFSSIVNGNGVSY